MGIGYLQRKRSYRDEDIRMAREKAVKKAWKVREAKDKKRREELREKEASAPKEEVLEVQEVRLEIPMAEITGNARVSSED